MSRPDDQFVVRETVGAYRKRKGVPRLNDTGRVTLDSFSRCTKSQHGRGYLAKIQIVSTGVEKRATKKTSVEAVVALLKTCSDDDVIYEIYPTRFCTNPRCGKASWSFLDYPHKGHSTCTYCGYTQKLVQSNMDDRHLGEDEKVNKSMWNCTPGMTVNDCLISKKGKRVQIANQRIRSHMRHFWHCQTAIDNIADSFYEQMGTSVEGIARRAKQMCKRFYYSIHNGNEDDNQRKMPHGQIQFAAACFYAATLEFTQTRRVRPACSLAAIQEEAAQLVNHRTDRRTRDVTIAVIIRYTKMLKQWELFNAHIPDITASTLRFASAETSKEHTRLAIFNQCQHTVIRLPSNKPWGIDLGDTERGVLYVENVTGGSAAFDAGVKKGDYVFQIEDEVVGVEHTTTSFKGLVGELKTKLANKPYIKLSIMRKKK